MGLEPVSFRKNGKTFSLAQLHAMVRMLSLGELRGLVKTLKERDYFKPKMAVIPAAAARAPIFLHGYHGPMGRKTKGRRDASLRSRANRRKAA